MIAGSRVSLRQIGTSNIYEAADSSYLQLIDNGGSLLVRATDGTQLSYSKFNNEWHCTQIKDRNGNYMTVNYDWLGHITTVIDTPARTITFNYDSNQNLSSITQSWTVNGTPTTHTWATFGWETRSIQSSSSGVMATGAPNGTIPVLNQVGLHDGSRSNFEYTAAGQVNRIRRHTLDNVQRSYTAYDYQTTPDDCPRLSATRVWAENWTGINGVPSEVVTQYGVEGSAHTLSVVGDPNSTLYKEFYVAGWQRGLTTQTEVWSAGVKRKWTSNNWTQDNTGVNYQTNPRLTQTNVHDPSNHRRTTIDYQTFTLPSGASCSLPSDMREYAGSAGTALRHTHTDYRMDPGSDASYLDRRILGLVKEQSLFEVNGSSETLMSKVGFQYDETGSIQGTDTPFGHDNSYDGNFVAGRGNLSSVKRYDANDTSQFTINSSKYNTAGAVVSTSDALSHQVTISYADAFSANGTNLDAPRSFATLAFPTTVTDADGHSSYVRYHYDFGAKTRTEGPPPDNQPQGQIQIFAYDAAARPDRVTMINNGAYTRYVHGPNYVQSFGTVNTAADEAYSIQVFDGFGRVTGLATNHPGSNGGYSAQNTIYDIMGRLHKQSNPTEVSSTWNPTGDDATGWLYRSQLYDWNSRPTVSTNTDSIQATNSYGGCGCAGGEITTINDAAGRRKRVYGDVLGRQRKTEILNFDNTVYASSVNSYNARDQVVSTKEYQGEEASGESCPAGTCQETTMSFDGYGRVASRHLPEQANGANTTYTYKADDSLWTVTDARGATVSYTYNARKLVTGINHSATSPIFVPAAVSFGYDAVGNRSSMNDGLGTMTYQYDQLSRLLSESRSLNDLPNAPVPNNAYTISYLYNLAGKLKSITDPFGDQVSYTHDEAGRLDSISIPSHQGLPDTMTNIQYRAFGKLKQSTIGWNANSSTISYTHDARMEVSRLQITSSTSANLQGAQYQRFGDGRVNYAQDLSDPEFDRAYSFDHMGRVTQGLTGAEARNTLPASGPYKQTYAYDAFSNLTSRTGRHWTKNVPAQTSSFANNRNTQWQYDLDGRATQAGTQQFRYDAAGRSVNPTGTLLDSYDGDGQRVKQYSSFARYELRSSVQGGQVVTLIGAQGNKEGSSVYANGKRVWAGGNWVIHSAVNSTVFNVMYGSVVFRANEFSPMGDNVGVENPYLSFGGDGSGGYPAYGNPSTFTCAIDGMQINCSSLNKFYLSKNWTFVLSKIIHGRFGGALNKSEATLIPGGDRLGQVVYGSAGPGGETSSVEIIAEPDSFELRSVGTMMNWIEMKPLETMSIAHGQEMRRMTPYEVSALIDDILKLFTDNPDCEKWTNKLLEELESSTGFRAGGIRDILEAFRKDGVLRTSGGQNGDGSGVSGWGLGYLAVNLSRGSTREETAVTLLHEIIHWAGRRPGKEADYYNDKASAAAWHKLGVVMSAEQYRAKFPDWVEKHTKEWRYDFAESQLAGAANKITCLNKTMPVRTLP